LGDGDSGTVLSHRHGTGFAYIKLHSPALRFVLHGMLLNGQLWTKHPFVLPTQEQHQQLDLSSNLSCCFLQAPSQPSLACVPMPQDDVPPNYSAFPEYDLVLATSVSPDNALRFPASPIEASDHSIHSLHRDALRVLWRARTGHINSRRLKDAHLFVRGIPPNLPDSDEANACPVCPTCKMRRRAASAVSSRTATQLYEGISIDFGFIVQRSTPHDVAPSSVPASESPPPTDWSQFDFLRGCNGETAYLLVRDHWSGALWGTCTMNKSPPIDWLTYWLLRHPCDSSSKYVRLDKGGDLGGSRKIHALFHSNGYKV
jgi:hypothetical protein